MIQFYADFKLVEGCNPCSFFCQCCDRTCHRCSSGEIMYIWENKYTKETYSILCGHCYKKCPQGQGGKCYINIRQ